jgi:hypothetical protein
LFCFNGRAQKRAPYFFSLFQSFKMDNNKELLLGAGVLVALIVLFVFHNFLSPIKTGKITLVPAGSQAAGNPYGMPPVGYASGGGYLGAVAGPQTQAYQNGNNGIIANQQMSGTNAYDVALQQQQTINNAIDSVGNAISGNGYSQDDNSLY